VDLKFTEIERKIYKVQLKYTLGSKDITTRKLATMTGVVVIALGTKVNKTIDIPLCFAVVIALYGL